MGWKEARKQDNKRASSRVKSVTRLTYEQRKQKQNALDDVRRKAQELLDARRETRKLKAKKRLEKQKRKEENEIKSGQYQVIKNTEKIRKWHKNARKQLKTMGPDQIERLLGK